MIGTNQDHCWFCGQDFLAGCVLTGECLDCERQRRILESAGWIRAPKGIGGFEGRRWHDPKPPGWIYGEQAALKIQEERDIEEMDAS